MGENYDALRAKLRLRRRQLRLAMKVLVILLAMLSVTQMVLGDWLSVLQNVFSIFVIIMWQVGTVLDEALLSQQERQYDFTIRAQKLRAADASLMLSLGEVGAAREILDELCAGLVSDG